MSGGIFIREEALGVVRVDGQGVAIRSPGTGDRYTLILKEANGLHNREIEVSVETFEELEEAIATLRARQPVAERTRSHSSLVMKKFMLDQQLFPSWPVDELVEAYRLEGALLDRRDVIKWREVLSRPDTFEALHNKLVLSVSRQESRAYYDAILNALADAAQRDAREWYQQLGRAAVIYEFEKSLVGAYPLDFMDADGRLAEARLQAQARILNDPSLNVVARPLADQRIA